MHRSEDEPASSPILDRPDIRRGFLNTAWPLLALALITLMLARACAPAAPISTASAPFDAAEATRKANAGALAALRALPSPPATVPAVAALNRAVINFAIGAHDVPADATELLQLAARVIAALPDGARIAVTGHTDNVGEANANLALSLRRAEAVRAALITRGAPAERLSAGGLGDGQPVAGNDTDAGRFRNRRIEFSAK
jgi:outer membrane protein OmpA-like peptidoglycan-associated protein